MPDDGWTGPKIIGGQIATKLKLEDFTKSHAALSAKVLLAWYAARLLARAPASEMGFQSLSKTKNCKYVFLYVSRGSQFTRVNVSWPRSFRRIDNRCK